MDTRKDLDGLSNEQLGAMSAPLPHRETDPMEYRRQGGTTILGTCVVGLVLWLLFHMIFG
jgi:hypothetical protein